MKLMANTAQQNYKKYIAINTQGQSILFARMQKALYRMLKSALLFYKKLVTKLELNGFKINPYGPCIMNKMVKGHQLTISMWMI